MPWLLKIMTIASLSVGVIGLILVCVPFATFQIYGEKVTSRELWSHGYGPFVVLAGLVALVAGVGLLGGHGWARWIVVFFYALLFPFDVVYGLRHGLNVFGLFLQTIAIGAPWAVFCYWYLFRKQSVRNFFP